METQRPPYEGVIDEYAARARVIGDTFPERLEKVEKIISEGGKCDAATVCFTHPEFSDKYRLEHAIYLLTLYSAAVELASLSGEVVARQYYGKMDGSSAQPLSKSDLEESLSGSNAIWFVTGDKRSPDTGEYDGYNHMIGIVPDPSSNRYIAMDVSGYINPLVPLSVDELYDEISRLPVGDEYIQGVVAFRGRDDTTEDVESVDEYFNFTPQ